MAHPVRNFNVPPKYVIAAIQKWACFTGTKKGYGTKPKNTYSWGYFHLGVKTNFDQTKKLKL